MMMATFIRVFLNTWGAGDTLFSLVLVGTIAVMLYTIALINHKLRLIENELQSLRKDATVMSDELEIVASQGKKAK